MINWTSPLSWEQTPSIMGFRLFCVCLISEKQISILEYIYRGATDWPISSCLLRIYWMTHLPICRRGRVGSIVCHLILDSYFRNRKNFSTQNYFLELNTCKYVRNHYGSYLPLQERCDWVNQLPPDRVFLHILGIEVRAKPLPNLFASVGCRS